MIDAGVPEKDLITFYYEDQGVATLEDGLYALDSKLKDPAFVDRLGKFIKASAKGWAYAKAHPDEAGKIVAEADASGATTDAVQTRMAENIAKLITASDDKIGWLDPEAYKRTVQVLLSSKSDPVITKDPGEAAWTHAAWDKGHGQIGVTGRAGRAGPPQRYSTKSAACRPPTSASTISKSAMPSPLTSPPTTESPPKTS